MPLDQDGQVGSCSVPAVCDAVFLPPGRAAESSSLQTSPHPRWSQDEGICPHDPVPGVLGGGQTLCTPAPQRQHDHREWEDQHHGMPTPSMIPQTKIWPSPAKITYLLAVEEVYHLLSLGAGLQVQVRWMHYNLKGLLQSNIPQSNVLYN